MRGRLSKSEDGGKTWSSINERFTDDEYIGIVCTEISCHAEVAVDPNDSETVYLRKAKRYFRSDDGGGSWQQIASRTEFGSIAVHPSSPGVVYLTTQWEVMKSNDKGETLTPVLSAYSAEVRFSPSDHNVVYAVGSTMFRSRDGGETWEEIGHASINDDRITQWAIHPVDPDILYASVSSSPDSSDINVYRSTDGGETWQAMGLSGQYIRALAVDPDNPNVVYAGGGSKAHPYGAHRSEDGGKTWTQIHDKYSLVFAFDPVKANTVYEGTSRALYRYSVGSKQTAVEQTSWGAIKSRE